MENQVEKKREIVKKQDSVKKRIRQNEKRRVINKASLSKMKTLVKKVYEAEDQTAAEKMYRDAVAYIDKVAVRGRIHKNNAARKKSALTLYVNTLPIGEKK